MNDDFLKELMPPLSQEDKDFAQEVMKYYKRLPFDDLCSHIRSFRNAATYNFPEVMEVNITNGSYRTPDIKEMKKLFESWLYILDGKVIEIAITTSRGTVNVNQPDLIKMYFNYSVKKIRDEYEMYLASEVNDFKSWIIDGHIAVLNYFLEKYTTLKKSQRFVVIGLFLVHFKIYRREPLLTKPEYASNQYLAQDYQHYLIDRVRPILPTILKKHPINFSGVISG